MADCLENAPNGMPGLMARLSPTMHTNDFTKMLLERRNVLLELGYLVRLTRLVEKKAPSSFTT